MSRAPRREEYTICTAVAPDAVFTVRTYGDTSPPYESGQVTKEGRQLGRTAHRAVVKRLEELGDNLPPARRELLVTLVSRLLDPAEPHASGDADDSECPAA